MADRRQALHLPHDVVAVEIAGDMPHRAVGTKFLAVKGGDSSGFLPAMLERVEAERDHRGGAVGAAYTTTAALLAELVDVAIGRASGRDRGGQYVEISVGAA